ncbi:MAG: hypothetical protein KC636_11805, partial [Myxococcales bacterium]|nr:hypothetical protein [Myxococcales bacterium]
MLRCWGANDFGQVGAPPSPYEDVALAQLGPVKQVDTSDSHTCAVNEVDEVWCWGENSYGQVGERGAAIPCGEGFCSPTPSRVDGVARVREVAVSSVHSCVLTDDGRVLCWGYNEDGNLGDGSGVSTPTPTEVVGLPGEVIALDVGRNGHFGAPTCVVVESGAVYCWGGDSVLTYVTPPDELEVNVYGVCQCAYAPVPVLINLPIPARDVSIGLFHACALGGGAAGPVVSCWG